MFLTTHPLSWSKLTKMNDNSYDSHFFSIRFSFVGAYNDKMRASNEY